MAYIRKFVKLFRLLKKLIIKATVCFGIIYLPEKPKRYHINLPILCFIDNYFLCNGTLLDIGKGGFSTRLPKRFTKGVKHDFALHLPSKGKLQTNVEIVWSHKEKNDSYKYGLKFNDIEKSEINNFCNCLHQLLDSGIKYDINDSKQFEQVYTILRNRQISTTSYGEH